LVQKLSYFLCLVPQLVQKLAILFPSQIGLLKQISVKKLIYIFGLVFYFSCNENVAINYLLLKN